MTISLPLVSIGIPTYNRANGFLKQAVQASLKQTYRNIEIIVSDNHSTDNTEEVVSSFKDSRIKYFRQSENIGMNNNFNFCVNQAKGEYFCLLPDDDLIDPDFAEACLKAVNQGSEVGIIRTGTRIIDKEGKTVAEYPNRVNGSSAEDLFMAWFAGKTSPYMCSSLLNRKRLLEIGGYRSKHCLFQDVGAEFKLAARYGWVDIVGVKASFRKHSEEMTFNTKVGYWCEDSLELLDILCELVPPEKEELLRSSGLPFLANLNYNRAKAVKSLAGRIAAFFVVYRKFEYGFLPSRRHLFQTS
ncbi:MAG: glycosyltransferase family 2 protein [Anaerolineales bacterium]|nr:glycosyltransferase family 2 protein [Anaerolineales bacterium]